jgi:hypothetical protein
VRPRVGLDSVKKISNLPGLELRSSHGHGTRRQSRYTDYAIPAHINLILYIYTHKYLYIYITINMKMHGVAEDKTDTKCRPVLSSKRTSHDSKHCKCLNTLNYPATSFRRDLTPRQADRLTLALGLYGLQLTSCSSGIDFTTAVIQQCLPLRNKMSHTCCFVCFHL